MPRDKCGSHTFSITAKSSYTEIQNIRSNQPCIRRRREKFSPDASYEIVEFKQIDVRIWLHQSLLHTSWITIIINPSSLLEGKYCPTELFSDVSKIPVIKQMLRFLLDRCGIDRKLKEFRLSRVDLTEDRYYLFHIMKDDDLAVFKKSFIMKPYSVIPFEGCSKAKEANKHSWMIGNKSRTTTFSVYDKTYELATRHKIYIDDSILRLELRLGHTRIRQLVSKGPWEEQLRKLIKQQDKLMNKFLHRIRQDCGDIVTEETAIEKIESSSFRTKTKKAMCKIVKLSEKCDTLEDVRKKMKISRRKFVVLLDKFRKIGINPIVVE